MIIGPGSPVIFVGHAAYSDSGLTKYALYFVKEVRHIWWATCEVCEDSDFLSLKGHPGRHGFYCVCVFRPLGGTDEEAKSLKVPVECVKADV